MEKEKPPVLNEWDALKRVTDGAIPYKDKTEVPVKRLLEAQRDADIEWYSKKLSIPHSSLEPKLYKAIQQARQETAREVINAFEQYMGDNAPSTFPWNGYREFVQSLKDKFLGGSQ